ncbi:helix-turn-helix transcriptional regulator [Streptomyces griseosporeus]|uniref:helix-turn-helix transcriptional regulator n=1 Tax=Streptomyces griseosporeus TaxID=1910 RepID=UPI0036FC73AD
MPRTPRFNTPPPPGYVWVDEASTLTGRSIEQLYKDRQEQKRTGRSNGPRSVSIGRKAAWRIKDIQAWLDGQTGPAPDADSLYTSRPAEPARAAA